MTEPDYRPGGDPIVNIPVPDPSTLTTEAVNAAIDHLRALIEAKLGGLAREFATFQHGHEEKHSSVVDAAIQHRRELSEAGMAVVQAQMDAQFASCTQRLDAIRSDVDQHHHQRLEAQASALATLAKLSDRIERIDEAVRGLDRVTDAKFVTFRTLVDSRAEQVALALNAANSAVDHAFNSSATAVAKAESFNEKRFDILGVRIDELTSYRDAALGKNAGLSTGWGVLLGAVGLIAAVLAIIGTR